MMLTTRPGHPGTIILRGFWNNVAADLPGYLRRAKATEGVKLIEAVISSNQRTARAPLLANGFEEAITFYNPNSHNQCTIFYYHL